MVGLQALQRLLLRRSRRDAQMGVSRSDPATASGLASSQLQTFR